MKVTLSICLLLLLFSSSAVRTLAAPPAGGPQPSISELDAAAEQAKQRVIQIVNQPITHLPRTEQAAIFSPGWFHPGAIKPDFDNVDVRNTQEMIYANDGYVTSDLNPNEMFVGQELEFNSMTKYFYVDRTLPKAKLSQGEMIEINNLYRIIGRDEDANAARRRNMTFLLLWVCGGLAAVLAGGWAFLARKVKA